MCVKKVFNAHHRVEFGHSGTFEVDPLNVIFAFGAILRSIWVDQTRARRMSKETLIKLNYGIENLNLLYQK